MNPFKLNVEISTTINKYETKNRIPLNIIFPKPESLLSLFRLKQILFKKEYK